MSIKKYLFAAFLGLGICAGNADVWGMEDQNDTQQQVQVTCAKVIRDYIDVIKINAGYGNVLAFKCKVKVNNVYQRDAIIVLKNGDFTPPRSTYVKFEPNCVTGIPVYYIPFSDILKSVGIGRYIGVAADAKENNAQWRQGADSFLEDIMHYQMRHLDFVDVLYDELGASKFQNDYNGINLSWWNKAKHTEVQFYVLKHLGVHEEIMIGNDRITLTGIDNVTELYSMFEPCTSCRELTLLTIPTIRKFEYFAFDKDMPNIRNESFKVMHDLGDGMWGEEEFKTNDSKKPQKVEIDPPCDWLKNARDISYWKDTQCASKRYRKVSKMYDSYSVKKNGDKHTCNLAGNNIKEDKRWINFDTKEFEQ